MAGFLITNNSNTHPPESWAIETAMALFDVGPDVPSERRLPAMKFQIQLAEVLTPHHATVQVDEEARLTEDHEMFVEGHGQFIAEYDPAIYLDQVIADIQAIAAGTPWEADFADPVMIAKVRNTVGNHFATAQNIQRQAFARENDHIEVGQEFLANLTNGGV